MSFTPVSLDEWERSNHFQYYRNILKCGYSVTVALDVTAFHRHVQREAIRFFPAFVYCVSRQIQEMREFRMGTDEGGNPGFYDCLHPNYTIFHEDDHTFSDLWTEYTPDFAAFYYRMTEDMQKYGSRKGVKIKPQQPKNFYCISCVPWLDFTGYSAYTQSGEPMLFPIITYGKITKKDGKETVPFCVNISHAAADGYHTSQFINGLQEKLNTFSGTVQ